MLPTLLSNITVQVIRSLFIESSLGAPYAVREKSSVIHDYTVYHQIIYFRIIKANDIVTALILCV